MAKIKINIPHTYVIISLFIVVAAVATWFVPGGNYTDNTVTINGVTQITKIYQPSASQPQTWQIFSATFDGFVKQAGIIVFILLIGGSFWIMNHSKAIDVGIMGFVRFSRKLENNKWLKAIGVNNIVITLIIIMFSLFGAVFGMSEETIAFIIIFVPLAISMGYDSIVGVNICFVAAALGFAGAILNPFTIGIAQELAGLPLFSGFGYRLICWLIITFAGILYILIYASKIKNNPKKSPMYKLDSYWRDKSIAQNQKIKYYTPISAYVIFIIITISLLIFAYKYPVSQMVIGNKQILIRIIPVLTSIFIITGIISLLKSVHYFILNLLFFTIAFLIVGVMAYSWYIKEIAALFFAMGIASGVAFNLNANTITKLFIDGAKDIMSAAFVVGLAGGIIIILQNGNIIDTIMYSLSQSMNNVNKYGTVSIMYAIQTLINIIIPSGSAKAALTMPIMAPFSDIIGLSRQATVMAFQFGDGFTNLITPTSGVLIGVLGVAKIPYNIWFKWVLPFVSILTIIGLLLLLPTVLLKLNGF